MAEANTKYLDILDDNEHPDAQVDVRAQEQKRKEKRQWVNRILFSVFLSLAYLCGSWSVTTWTFRRFPRPIGPSPELAAEALRVMRVDPKMTGQVWEQCIRDESRLCAAQLDEARDDEQSRINTVHAANQVKLDEASQLQTTCALKYSEGETLFRDLVLAGETLPFNLNDNICPVEDREEILENAGADVRRGQEEIIGIIARMNEENRHQLVTIESFLQDYATYHRDYFFGRLKDLELDLIGELGNLTAGFDIRLPAGIDGLITCVSPDSGGLAIVPCPMITPVSASLDRVRETARAIIRISKEQLDLAAMVIATLVDRYDWAVGSIEDLVRIFQGIRNVLGRPFDLAFDRFGGGIDFSQFDNLPSGYFYVSGDLDFPNLPDVPPIDAILAEFKQQIERVKEETREIAAQATDEIREKVAALVVKVGEAFDGILEDYNPPKLSFADFGDITNLFDVRNQQFRTRFEAAVNSLKVTRNRLPEADTQLPPASLGEWEEVRDGVEDAAPTLLDFDVPTIPAFILRFFMWISMFYGVYDFSFRVWLTIQRILRFSHEAEVPVPKVIVGTPGTDREEEEAEQEKQKRSKLKKIIDFAFDKKWIMIIMLVIGIFCVTGMVVIILDYQGHYIAKCVESEAGTALSQGLVLPIIHNAAKLDGEAALRQERLKRVGQRNLACTALIASSSVVHRQQEENLFLIKHEYNKTMTESDKILNCVNLDAIGDEGPQLNVDLSTCADPLDVGLDNGVARCWEKCEIDCNEGKITQEITQVVMRQTCIYEWYLLSSLWLVLLQLVQYCLFNLSILLFGCAVITLLRKRFRRDSIKWVYEEDCESGEIVGAEGLSLEEAKAEALRKYNFWATMIALAQFALFITLNAIWIYARIHVARSNDWLRPQWFEEQ